MAPLWDASPFFKRNNFFNLVENLHLKFVMYNCRRWIITIVVDGFDIDMIIYIVQSHDDHLTFRKQYCFNVNYFTVMTFKN